VDRAGRAVDRARAGQAVDWAARAGQAVDRGRSGAESRGKHAMHENRGV
jgi:hypothetical protein